MQFFAKCVWPVQASVQFSRPFLQASSEPIKRSGCMAGFLNRDLCPCQLSDRSLLILRISSVLLTYDHGLRHVCLLQMRNQGLSRPRQRLGCLDPDPALNCRPNFPCIVFHQTKNLSVLVLAKGRG